MKINDLTCAVKSQLEKKMNIKYSLSILNIPKQKLLEKGDIVILLDDNKKPIICEFLKVGTYHMELKDVTFPKLLIENIFNTEKLKMFETLNDFTEYANDYLIDYSDLESKEKKEIRTFINLAEKKIEESSTRFGKLNKQILLKTIATQNGTFTLWMKEHNYTIPNDECLNEAFIEADKFHDFFLKKRASFAKTFYKISELKKISKK